MRVIFTSPSVLHYKGKTYTQGEELEITENFFNAHQSRFKKVDGNFVMDGECEEIRNVKPEKPKTRKKAAKK